MKQPAQRATRSTYVPPNTPKSVEVRELAAFNVANGIWSPKEAADISGCTPGTARRWASDFKKGKVPCQKLGRPSLVSPTHLAEVQKTVDEASAKSVHINNKTFSEMLQAAADETAEDEHKVPRTLSDRYKSDVKRSSGYTNVNAEILDNAHEVALNDPRHAASYAAMMHFLHDKVLPGLFINIDKTSFEMKMESKENASAVLSGKRKQRNKCKDPYESGAKSGNCSIHLYVVANDSGKLADMVYIVKDKNMPKDATDLYETPYLDGSTGSTGTAYLMFVGDSSPNTDKTLEWLYENIVVPFVNNLRRKEGVDGTAPASLTVDGDPRQLQVLASAFMVDSLRLANIITSKSPASCTPLFQPLDVGKLFLSSKRCFGVLMKADYTPTNTKHTDKLKEVFKTHTAKYPKKYKKNKKPSVAMSTYFKNAMRCLLTAAAALRKSAVSETVVNSFRDAGVMPFDPVLIRNKCQHYLNADQKRSFNAAVPELAKIFARNSELKESDFDKYEIPMPNVSKDNAPVHRRRSLLLHAAHVLEDLKKQAEKAKAK